MPQLIFVVEDTLTIKGRGVALVPAHPGIWGSGEAEVGDMIEIRADGAAPLTTRIKALDWQPCSSSRNRVKSGRFGFVIDDLIDDLPVGPVKPGYEVWTAEP